MAKQILGPVEGNAEFARAEKYARRQQIVVRARRGDRHGPGAKRCLGPVELLGQPPPPALLLPEFAAVLDRLELPEQGSAVDQKGLAGLIAAETVEQLNRAATPDAEDFLDRSTVKNRG